MPLRLLSRALPGLFLALLIAPAFAARPPAAAVVSAHPLATQAGLETLRAGGNAFDAAVAVAAALAVVEPYGSGLGGGGFFLLHRAEDGHEVMLDARERAPGAAHPQMYLGPDGHAIPEASLEGPLAAGIPGTPAALEHLAVHYGQLPLAASLSPAETLARLGFALDEHYLLLAGFRLAALRQDPEAARLFLAGGELPPVGHTLLQPELAELLAEMGRRGAAAFYHGEFARKLVEGVKAGGGIWTLADLAGYQLIERAPLVSRYQGMRVVSAAPPSAGGVALATSLNILEGYPPPDLDTAAGVHLVAEAMRRAYRDRAQYLGDPDFVEMPLALLTDPRYAAGLSAGIHPERATPSALLAPVRAEPPGGESTTHFSVLDAEGNRVAATLSLNLPFGAAYVPPGTGILLNNEMDDFSAEPGAVNAYGLMGSAANAVAPGKRPLSSMTPVFLEANDRLAVLGTPGGSRIITMVMLAALEFAAGADAATMAARPRFHHQYLPDRIEYEPGALTGSQRDALTAMGHTLHETSRRYGDMQVIVWDCRRGTVTTAADPRGRGQGELLWARAAAEACD